MYMEEGGKYWAKLLFIKYYCLLRLSTIIHSSNAFIIIKFDSAFLLLPRSTRPVNGGFTWLLLSIIHFWFSLLLLSFFSFPPLFLSFDVSLTWSFYGPFKMYFISPLEMESNIVFRQSQFISIKTNDEVAWGA